MFQARKVGWSCFSFWLLLRLRFDCQDRNKWWKNRGLRLALDLSGYGVWCDSNWTGGCRVSGLGSFVYLDGPDGETLNFFSFLMTVLLCRNRVELTGGALYRRF